MNALLDAYVNDLLGSPAAQSPTAEMAAAPDPVSAPRQDMPAPRAPAAPARALATYDRSTAANEPMLPARAVSELPPRWKEAEAAADSVRWLCFLLGGQAYAVKVVEVQEVLRVPDIAPVAGAPGDLVGVINLRGHIVPVLDLRRRLGLGAGAESAERRIVVLERQGDALGLLVDAVAEVFLARADSVQETGLVPGAMPTEWFCGFLRRGGELVVALDGRRLLEG